MPNERLRSGERLWERTSTMNTNRCNQTMIEPGRAEGWSADAIISVPGSSADRSNRAEGTCARGLLTLRESESERAHAISLAAARCSPPLALAAGSGEPRHPRNSANPNRRGRGEKWEFARAARIPHTRFPTNHSGGHPIFWAAENSRTVAAWARGLC